MILAPMTGMCQKRHKLLRLPADKITTERMGNIVPQADVIND
jgi:hypothetical protein